MSLPEDMTRCPYNTYHILLKSRLTTHLCKCRRQYKGNDFSNCPFNASHTILTPELQYHIENCPDRKRLEDDLYVIDDPDDEREKAYQIAHDIKLPPPSENWDNEPKAPMSYLDVKDELIMKRPVLRVPVGRTKSERKKFFESEVKRFESIRAASCSYNTRKDSDVSQTKSQETQKKSRETKPLTTPPDDDSDEEEYSVIKKERQGRASKFSMD